MKFQPALAAMSAAADHKGEIVNGNVIQHWSIAGLEPSTDVIPYQPAGTLWEATPPTGCCSVPRRVMGAGTRSGRLASMMAGYRPVTAAVTQQSGTRPHDETVSHSVARCGCWASRRIAAWRRDPMPPATSRSRSPQR